LSPGFDEDEYGGCSWIGDNDHENDNDNVLLCMAIGK